MTPLFGGLFKGKVKEIIESGGKVLDDLITNKEEREAAKLAQASETNRHMEVLEKMGNEYVQMILADKQSAREMYKHNSSLQKIYAIVFLAGYVLLSCGMCYMIYLLSTKDAHVPEWGIGFISTIFGAMSMKVGTVTDFLFGASMTPESTAKQ